MVGKKALLFRYTHLRRQAQLEIWGHSSCEKPSDMGN